MAKSYDLCSLKEIIEGLTENAIASEKYLEDLITMDEIHEHTPEFHVHITKILKIYEEQLKLLKTHIYKYNSGKSYEEHIYMRKFNEYNLSNPN